VDGFCDPFNLVAAEIVEDHDVSRPERGAEKLLYPGQEQFAVHGSVGDHWSGQLVQSEPRDECRCLPVAEGRRSDASLPPGSPPMAPRHIGRRPCFINKYKPFNVHTRLRFSPKAARLLNVLAFLLAGVQSFF
jgi:hypothetical protein